MKMQAGAERFGAVTKYGEVTSVELREKVKKVVTTSGEYFSRTVVIATGADPRTLGIAGEDELYGRGIHYCGHCDGRFYKGKTVAVVGGGNTAAEDAIYLSRLASKVYLVYRKESLSATKIYHDPLERAENVEMIANSTVSSVSSEQKVSGVTIKNLKSGEEGEIALDGIFVSIGRKPNTYLFEGQIELDKNGYIVADETTRTSLDGVYAIGDVRTKALRQVVTAVSDGAVAVHFAEEYIATGE
jgi:thioredoxin reductase (NADPH)